MYGPQVSRCPDRVSFPQNYQNGCVVVWLSQNAIGVLLLYIIFDKSSCIKAKYLPNYKQLCVFFIYIYIFLSPLSELVKNCFNIYLVPEIYEGRITSQRDYRRLNNLLRTRTAPTEN